MVLTFSLARDSPVQVDDPRPSSYDEHWLTAAGSSWLGKPIESFERPDTPESLVFGVQFVIVNDNVLHLIT